MGLGRFELCLNVSDIARSRAFYENLGFVPIGGEQNDGWLIMREGATRIGLFQGHIESNVLNFRGGDVFAIGSALEAKGLKLQTPAHVEEDGSAGAEILDPDGNLVYFNTSPGEETGLLTEQGGSADT